MSSLSTLEEAMNVGSDVLILSGQNFEEDLEFAELGVAVPEEVVI